MLWARGRGGGFAKFVTLGQFNELSMFPCFIVSDANYDSMTCNSNPLLIWPLPRCNEDPDCRNPRGFRIANIFIYIYCMDLVQLERIVILIQ